jgi:hypothetical protein
MSAARGLRGADVFRNRCPSAPSNGSMTRNIVAFNVSTGFNRGFQQPVRACDLASIGTADRDTLY